MTSPEAIVKYLTNLKKRQINEHIIYQSRRDDIFVNGKDTYFNQNPEGMILLLLININDLHEIFQSVFLKKLFISHLKRKYLISFMFID